MKTTAGSRGGAGAGGAIQATPFFNYIASESSFGDELINKGRLPSRIAQTVTWLGGTAGVEAVPFHGSFSLGPVEGHLATVFNAGLGAGLTSIEVIAPVTCAAGDLTCTASPGAYASTGIKPMASIGGGLRFSLGQYFAVHLEIRDLLYAGETVTSLPVRLPVGTPTFTAEPSATIINNVQFFGDLSVVL
jgi:hypothetical protein